MNPSLEISKFPREEISSWNLPGNKKKYIEFNIRIALKWSKRRNGSLFLLLEGCRGAEFWKTGYTERGKKARACRRVPRVGQLRPSEWDVPHESMCDPRFSTWGICACIHAPPLRISLSLSLSRVVYTGGSSQISSTKDYIRKCILAPLSLLFTLRKGRRRGFLLREKYISFFSFFFYYCDAGLGLDKGGKEGWEGR